MKHTLFLLYFISAFTNILIAQDVRIINTNNNCDTISKKILDNTKYRIYYSYYYMPDSMDLNIFNETLTLLQIGDKYNRFIDYNRFRSDSVNDVSAKLGLAQMEYMPSLMNLGRAIKFKSNLVINKVDKEILNQQNIILTERYQYAEEIPSLKWTITNSDTLILGYKCVKATTNYKGRSYIAWFSEDIPIPYGPYKFNNLPGLIFYIHDTNNNHSFMLSGLEQRQDFDPIYQWTGSNIIKTKRENAFQIYKNYCANPAKALMNTGKKITIAPEVLATVQPLPYNPIELE